MQNVQNADIQQRVMNLVDFYRTKVGKESKIAKEAKAERECWDEINLSTAIDLHNSGFHGPIGIDMPEAPEIWVKTLCVNDQLLGHFYAEVVDGNADKEVLDQLLPDVYDKTVFTEEEEDFLKLHFKEMVNYIIQTPCDDLEWVSKYDDKDRLLLPNEVLELIKSHVEVPAGAKVYYPFAGFSQFTNLYDGCHFYFDEIEHFGYKEKYESWIPAWKKLALHANNVDAEFLKGDVVPHSFDASVSFVPVIPKIWDSIKAKDDQGRIDEFEYSKGYDPSAISKIHQMYNGLLEGGKMILITKSEYFWDKEGDSPLKPFWELLIADNAIVEIIQLPSVMNWIGHRHCDGIILIAEKGRRTGHTTMMDVRAAFRESNKENSHKLLDIDAIYAIENNHGKDPITGLRKMVQIPSADLKANLLLPEVYVVERPSEEEHPVPLSSICNLESSMVRDVQFDLPEDTPWVTVSDLTPLYTGHLNMSDIRKANCPNNPPFVESSKEYAFDMNGRFIDDIFDQMGKSKGIHVVEYRRCTFFDGNSDAVLFKFNPTGGVSVALVRATGEPIAVSEGILVFRPKDFDVEFLAALLRLPIVYRQIQAYKEYGIGEYLDDILAPTDKCVIRDELSRMKREESVTNELGDKVQAMKIEYINEVRMRKHDMGQYIFELVNIEDLMRYYIEHRENEPDFCNQIENLLDNFRSSLGELSTLLDNLSKEEQFGEPEVFNVNSFLSLLPTRHKADGFKIIYNCDEQSIIKYNQIMRVIDDDIQDCETDTLDDDISEIETDMMETSNIVPPLYVAPNDLQRAINNILDNARKHGFTDSNRNDYEIDVKLSIDSGKNMFVLDFRNNGNPLPEGMNKMRYGLKGEKAGKTAGTGLGGNYVKSFVEHYSGDYDVFMEDGWTVVRIYLPIK